MLSDIGGMSFPLWQPTGLASIPFSAMQLRPRANFGESVCFSMKQVTGASTSEYLNRERLEATGSSRMGCSGGWKGSS